MKYTTIIFSILFCLLPKVLMSKSVKDSTYVYMALGDKHYFGIDVPKDERKAAYWFRKAANEGNAYSMHRLANIFCSGNTDIRDSVKAAFWWEHGAELGNYYSIENIAWFYLMGYGGLPRNVSKAIEWIKRGVELGYTGCYERLGELYLYELGDSTEAFSSFKKGAELNDSDCIYNLACCYDNGIGTARNSTKAVYWFRKGAIEGQSTSMNNLGFKYKNGDGVGKDSIAAFYWYKRSAEAGYYKGMVNTGDGYLRGDGTSTDYRKALYWYKRALETGNYDSHAMAQLGYMYENGLGTDIDTAEAKYWFREGAKRNSAYCINKLKEYGELPPELLPEFASESKMVVSRKDYNTVLPSEKRLALVIGNSSYQGGNSLANTVHDASDIADKLEELGFHVIRMNDQDKDGMDSAILRFGKEAAGYDVALFYYAGHGISVGGINYLVPVNAKLQNEASVENNCINAGNVLNAMDKAGCKMKIMILDACRNNPFTRAWHRGSVNRGLSSMKAGSGTIIAFSTALGSIADDGKAKDRNSPYAAALLKMLDHPNASFLDILENVGRKVSQDTESHQQPFITYSLTEDFYLKR